MMSFLSRKRFCIWIGLGAVVLAVCLSLINLEHGNLNQDEGWYLYAAKLVAAGQMPYQDFAFTQGPVFPFVYGAFYPVVERWGVAGGRAITALLGLSASFAAALLASRISSRNRLAVAVITFLLVGCNVYQSYFTTVVKTYALCSLLMLSGFYLLSFYKHWWGCFSAGVLFALSAGCRLSAGIILPLAGLWLLWQRREIKRGWIWFGIGGAFALLLAFAPFLLRSFEQTRFFLFDYHTGREGGGALFKVGFVSRFVRAYFLLVLLTLWLLLRQKHAGPSDFKGMRPFLWICGIAVSAVHFFAPFPYDDYQVIIFPVFCAALAGSLISSVKVERVPRVLMFFLLVSVAGAFSSPINQDWFIRGRDRIWWERKEKSDLMLLREAAAYVQANSPEESVLLTQDVYLAVEAGRDVPPGMEMGPFCFYPEMSDEQAEKMHLLNQSKLLEILSQGNEPMAAFSGYGLAIESPSLIEVSADRRAELETALMKHYEADGVMKHFGQAHTTLRFFKKKAE
ncbi:hypothetical protein ACFLQY_04370 [Verrucomicrobiota bacterium]